MKIDEQGRYVFVGTNTGLVQAFDTKNFVAASDVLTISTYPIHNITTYCAGKEQENLHIIIALGSGQIVLYK